MPKPQINKITTFDARYDAVVSMSYLGHLPHSNRIIIYDAVTMTVVYDQTKSGLALEHTIPADTLTNGKKYAVQGQVSDSFQNTSPLSDKAYFWCLATPSFYFQDIPNDTAFRTASIYAPLIYEQENGEEIDGYRFYLYDDLKNLLVESETFFTTDNMNYAYRGLTDDRFYYIRAAGTTVNGIALDTGYIKIFINYENPKDYKLIDAQCNEQNSVVTYQTNFVVINPSDTDTQYEYNDGFINLIDRTLVYDKDFQITGDFTLTIRGRDLYRTATILKCTNNITALTLSSYIYDDDRMRYKLAVSNGLCNYILYSEPLLPDKDDIVTIHIRRINYVYRLECFVEKNTAAGGEQI